MNKVNCKIINKSNNPLPNYQSEGAAAVDLTAFLKEDIICLLYTSPSPRDRG